MVVVQGLLILNCNNNPVGPKEQQPGRRDYVWEIDTLETPYNFMKDIWGAAPTDVWVVGDGGSRTNRLWHFDGTVWEVYNKEPIWCVGRALHSFSADNIWMGGGAGWLSEGAGIWHYNGEEWKEFDVYNVEEANNVKINSIHGKSPSNIYACGIIAYDQESEGRDSFRGFILHYNGKRWAEVYRASWESQFLEIIQTEHGVYVHSFENWETDTFYKLAGRNLDTILSRSNAATMNLIDGTIYFMTSSKKIYQIGGINIPYKLWQTFNLENFRYEVYGRHKEDLFLRMLDGVAHYNGTDIQQLYTFPEQSQARIMYEPMIFKEDVFFTIRDPSLGVISNMILHGKLQEDKED